MKCKSDKDSIVFSDDKGPMILEFYRAPSGDIRIGGFGGFKGIYFDSEDARRLHGWLSTAIDRTLPLPETR